jgi:hypothetical protein
MDAARLPADAGRLFPRVARGYPAERRAVAAGPWAPAAGRRAPPEGGRRTAGGAAGGPPEGGRRAGLEALQVGAQATRDGPAALMGLAQPPGACTLVPGCRCISSIVSTPVGVRPRAGRRYRIFSSRWNARGNRRSDTVSGRGNGSPRGEVAWFRAV